MTLHITVYAQQFPEQLQCPDIWETSSSSRFDEGVLMHVIIASPP